MRSEALVTALLLIAAGCGSGDCRETCWAAEYDGFLPSALGEGSSPEERVASCAARCEASSTDERTAISGILSASPGWTAASQRCGPGVGDAECAASRPAAFEAVWCDGDRVEPSSASLARDRLRARAPISAGRLRIVAEQAPQPDAFAIASTRCRLSGPSAAAVPLDDPFCTALAVTELDFFVDEKPLPTVTSSCFSAGHTGVRTDALSVGLHSIAVEIHHYPSSNGVPACIRIAGGSIALGSAEDGTAVIEVPSVDALLNDTSLYGPCSRAGVCEELPAECDGRASAALGDASTRIDQRSDAVTSRIVDGCRALAIHLGAAGSEIPDSASWQTQLAWCQRAAQLRMLRSDLVFGHGSTLCAYGLSKSAACEASCAATPACEASLDDPLGRCDGGALAGSCTGSCVGGCVWDQPVACEGPCFGACAGTCDGTPIGGAACGGTCTGDCVGECRYAAADALTCPGICYGHCSASLLAPFCETAPAAPMASCGACSTCQDICLARGGIETECQDRKARVLGGGDADDPAALAAAAGVVLGGLDEVERVVAAAQELESSEAVLEAQGGGVAECAALRKVDLDASLAQALEARAAATALALFL